MKIPKWLFLAVFLVIFDVFFWVEKMGVNVFIFTTSILVFLIFQPKDEKSTHSKPNFLTTLQLALQPFHTRFALFCALLSGVMLVWHNSLVSTTAHILSVCVAVAFLHENRFNTLFVVFSYFLRKTVGLPFFLYQKSQTLPAPSQSLKKYRFSFYVYLVPAFIFGFFFIIFMQANPFFNGYVSAFTQKIGEYFHRFFAFLSIGHIFFILFGFFVLVMALYHFEWQGALEIQDAQSNHIIRSRKDKAIEGTFLGLKNDYRMGVMSILSVNVLLFFVNLIDIIFVWFGKNHFKNTALANALHEGTYMLIFSIFLAMGILAYFFRQNLNFYPKNEFLKKLAFLWLFQNGILLVSVALRAIFYIQEHGLAYKRLGVLIFLVLTLLGLWTMFVKIKYHKSFYFLLQTNSWSVYVMLVLMSCVDWDTWIVQYNVNCLKENHKKRIDIDFLYSLADKTLPILLKNKGILQPEKEYYDMQYTRESHLKLRCNNFIEQQQKFSWLSFNYKEHQALQILLKYKKQNKF